MKKSTTARLAEETLCPICKRAMKRQIVNTEHGFIYSDIKVCVKHGVVGRSIVDSVYIKASVLEGWKLNVNEE